MSFSFAEFTNATEPLDSQPQYLFDKPKDSLVGKILRHMKRGQNLDSSKPVKVECGPKPANASTNCVPNKKPCLYNVKMDPCEYNNIADQNPGKNLIALYNFKNRFVQLKILNICSYNHILSIIIFNFSLRYINYYCY